MAGYKITIFYRSFLPHISCFHLISIKYSWLRSIHFSVIEVWYFYGLPPSHVSIPPNQNGTTDKVDFWTKRLLSAKGVRSVRLSTAKSQVFSVDCIACHSCPLALPPIGRTRNRPYSIYLNRGCTCVAHVSCCCCCCWGMAPRAHPKDTLE